MTHEELLELIETVIDENGEMRACGREQCGLLIESCSKVFPTVSIGDSETNYIDLKSLIIVYNFLKLSCGKDK